ncbi:mediator of RNA polymerase II transcription subunit 33A-like protein [Tanacetum coccineum]
MSWMTIYTRSSYLKKIFEKLCKTLKNLKDFPETVEVSLTFSSLDYPDELMHSILNLLLLANFQLANSVGYANGEKKLSKYLYSPNLLLNLALLLIEERCRRKPLMWHLLDALLDDEGLLDLVPEKKSTWSIKPHEMEIDDHIAGEKKMDHSERLYKTNTTLAIEIIGELYRNKVTSRILYLARLNIKLNIFEKSKEITPEALLQLTSDNRVLPFRECKTMSTRQFHASFASQSLLSSATYCHGASHSAA